MTTTSCAPGFRRVRGVRIRPGTTGHAGARWAESLRVFDRLRHCCRDPPHRGSRPTGHGRSDKQRPVTTLRQSPMMSALLEELDLPRQW